MDDGSTDSTARIAEKYAALQPDCFRLIRQQNSGYGSTITAALASARGRYFRTLDCDDWFDPNALARLLRYLEICYADVVFTNYCTVREEQLQQEFYVCQNRDPTKAYTFLGLAAARTLRFCPVMLYHYRLGRDGQSVSLENYQRHFADYEQVTEQVLAAADTLPDNAGGRRLKERARDIAQYGIELLLRFPSSADTKRQLKEYDTALRARHPALASRMTCKNTRLLRISGYGLYRVVQRYVRRKAGEAR